MVWEVHEIYVTAKLSDNLKKNNNNIDARAPLHVLLQMSIIITGNYNFFNLLTITLCLSLLDDSFSLFSQKPMKGANGKKKSNTWSVVSLLANVVFPSVVLGYIAYETWQLFSLRIMPDWTIYSKIAFNEKSFFQWLEKIMPYTVYLGAGSLTLEIVISLVKSIFDEKGLLRKGLCIAGTSIFGSVAVFMFVISLVPHTQVHKPTQLAVPKVVTQYHGLSKPFHLTSSYGLFRSFIWSCLFLLDHQIPLSYLDLNFYHSLPKYSKTWHSKLDPFQITSSYGLFRMMTGADGRPELILEGLANNRTAEDGWKPYAFLYKPGDVSECPPVVAPHQPRLDWQMWFAALSNYQNNPWFLNLVYRLLQNEPDVLDLMGPNPFPNKPPKYIRAFLYHYHFTSPKDCKGKTKCNWWKREKKSEYIPALSLTEPTFVEYLKHNKILQEKPTKKFKMDGKIAKFLKWAREAIGQPEGFSFSLSMFGSAILVMFFNRAVF
ncbi:lipase maturation factor 2 isoform X2 [Biomphalaria pfeifferi]|uniref:Lipase maturation factor n=1 Tax=Biomphalaria pfeifferi TaxID=112525 RepID=A0AAD8F927_BIOPF|nr:lipase maturation factor 2 isoform X2 [Biomphalaria pfeifferi]